MKVSRAVPYRRWSDKEALLLAAPLLPRVVTLPMDLLRHELLMNLQPPSGAAIVEIVDTVFLPLATVPRRRGSGE